MLPRAAFFNTLSTLNNADSREWHATVAGLVTLRLVDECLDSGHRALTDEDSDLAAVKALIAQVPDANLLQGLLTRIIDTVQQVDKMSPQVVAPTLFDYAKMLQSEGKLHLAQDVLASLQQRAIGQEDIWTIIHTSRRLGFVQRLVGQLDLAQESYSAAIFYAKRANDKTSILLSRLGKAHIAVAQGDI